MIEYENLARFNKPFVEEYKKSFATTLESGWFILGKNVRQFEQEFGNYLGTKHCIGVASGLDALILALRAFDFEKESEIIVPSNTYIATIFSILHNGLVPVLVEPDIATYNIDPKKIEEKITPRTRAIMVVHLYGKPCAMEAIVSIAKKYKLKLIEDCAQSHGAKYKGVMAGTFGEVNAWSFYPTKNLGALGDGGAVTMDDEKLCDSVSMLRNYGSRVKYYNEVVGFNSRLDEVQAGFLSIKLKKLDDINRHKRALAEVYLKNLKKDFVLPAVHPDFFDVYHIFAIRHPKRDELREYLLKNEIKTDIHYPVAPHKQTAVKDFFAQESFPISEEIHATTLSLPISYFHTESDIMRVVEVMNKF